MPRQAMNTLYSLSAAHQRDVDGSDYEVIVMENASDRNLDPAAVAGLEGDVRYVRRREPGVSPAPAINDGLSRCRGDVVGLMIDGARMVTPGVVRHVLDAFAVTSRALVAVPGYHLGPLEQHRVESGRYDESVERELLEAVEWRSDGYALFDIACVSGANPRGFFHPFLESNCMFASREAFADIGGADERFDLPGGGSLNLFMYRSLGVRPESRLFVLPGEGSFHQIHGGVTTTRSDDRRERLARQNAQLERLWGDTFHSLRREAVMLGPVPDRAMPFLEWSAARGFERHRRIRTNGGPEWPDEPAGRPERAEARRSSREGRRPPREVRREERGDRA